MAYYWNDHLLGFGEVSQMSFSCVCGGQWRGYSSSRNKSVLPWMFTSGSHFFFNRMGWNKVSKKSCWRLNTMGWSGGLEAWGLNPRILSPVIIRQSVVLKTQHWGLEVWGLNPQLYDHGSNTLTSGLWWHILINQGHLTNYLFVDVTDEAFGC